MHSCGFWLFSKTSEVVCQEGSYKTYFIWETIYMDSFWQVQRRHCLREMQFEVQVPLSLLSQDQTLSNVCSCNSSECMMCTELPFRIVSNIGSENIVVAMATSSESIMQNFLQYLIQNVTPLLQIFNSTSLGTNQISQQFQFVTMKIRALIEKQNLETNTQTQCQLETEAGTTEHLEKYFDINQPETIVYCTLRKTLTLFYSFNSFSTNQMKIVQFGETVTFVVLFISQIIIFILYHNQMN